MTRTQLACYSLMASAFLLAGLLIVNLPDRLAPQANAAMVLNKDTLTLLTARTRSDEEALFVLDSLNAKLLIYRLDIGKKQIELAGTADLTQLFETNQEDSGKRSGR